MILLLGAAGYIGQAFARELRRRGWPFVPLSRRQAGYSRFDTLLALLESWKPVFMINAAGYAGKPNVDAAETQRAEALLGNVVLPQTIAQACAVTGTPWGHVSSGCIYSGTRIADDGGDRIETDLARPEFRALAEASPERIRGFNESDVPNFSFTHPPCSFYSGSKALGEEVVAGLGRAYIWRLRIPFDEFDGPRNYLSKLQRYAKVYDSVNSISHRGDFVAACLDLWEHRAPFGIYNVTNPGFVTTRRSIAMIEQYLRPGRAFAFWADDAEFYRLGVSTPRSNCVLDVSKLLAAGVRMRPVADALADALRRWQPERQAALAAVG